MKTAFFCNTPEMVDSVFAMGRREQISEISELYSAIITEENFDSHADALQGVEAVFSTWGMFALPEEKLEKLPALKWIFYAASSVRSFAQPYMRRGVHVMSAWAANAVPVAEFALAQILLANKGYFANIRVSGSPDTREAWNRLLYKGNFRQTVAVLGAGQVGRKLIGMLRNFELDILIYDPYVSEGEAVALGGAKVTLEEAFARADVVSNHMPDLDATAGVLNGALFSSLREGGVFINTGRGRTVNESEMTDVLRGRPDLTALLDVTWPEPPEKDSPLYALPNVVLSNHIAGSLGNEVVRMADYCIGEFVAVQDGRPLKYEVTPKMLETMA